MVPIFPPWKKSPLSTLSAGRLPVPHREARVAAVCGFLPRLRVCVRRGRKSPRCTDVQRTKSQSSKAIAILRGGAAEWMSFRALRGSEGYGACADDRIWLVAGPPAPCQMPQIGQKPIPTTSSQSPLRVYRPAGEGIPRSAPLLLSSKQNPLRWAFVW